MTSRIYILIQTLFITYNLGVQQDLGIWSCLVTHSGWVLKYLALCSTVKFKEFHT